MEFLDLSKIAQIGTLVLVVVQYIKKPIPEVYLPYISILIGIAISFLLDYRTDPFDPITMIINGVLGAVGADTGYGFLSKSKSPAFTLASRADLQAKVKKAK